MNIASIVPYVLAVIVPLFLSNWCIFYVALSLSSHENIVSLKGEWPAVAMMVVIYCSNI